MKSLYEFSATEAFDDLATYLAFSGVGTREIRESLRGHGKWFSLDGRKEKRFSEHCLLIAKSHFAPSCEECGEPLMPWLGREVSVCIDCIETNVRQTKTELRSINKLIRTIERRLP